MIAIGPVTGKALREAGVIPYMTGNSYDIPGILKGLTEEKRDKCTAVQEGGHFYGIFK